MSDAITLTLRAPLEQAVEADGIAPDRFAALGAREIAALPIWAGRKRLPLGELFDVRGERASVVHIEGGDTLARLDALGAGMQGGELHVAGRAGRYVGSRMAGGRLRVDGDAGDGAGLEMAGGVLEIGGRAGDRLGAARLGAARGMTGGEIIVRGDAGAEAGASARRGTIVIGGNAGERAGYRMIAGSVIILGAAGAEAGSWTKRGSIVALGLVAIPTTFRYDCTYRPPHLALALTRLRVQYHLPIDAHHVRGLYRRYSGDLAELGKGEILAWTGE